MLHPRPAAAAALVVLPVAVSTATELGVSPRTFGILVTLAASLAQYQLRPGHGPADHHSTR